MSMLDRLLQVLVDDANRRLIALLLWIAASGIALAILRGVWQTLDGGLIFLKIRSALYTPTIHGGKADVTSTLRHLETRPVTVTPGHTHPKCAGRRRAAAQMMVSFVQKMGLLGYAPHVSSLLAKLGVRGARPQYNVKDSSRADLGNSKPGMGEADILVDDDSHYSRRQLSDLLTSNRICVMYTWCLRTVAGTSDELSFSWDGKDWDFKLPGANSQAYNHQLWDWTQDQVSAISATFRWWFYPSLLALVAEATWLLAFDGQDCDVWWRGTCYDLTTARTDTLFRFSYPWLVKSHGYITEHWWWPEILSHPVTIRYPTLVPVAWHAGVYALLLFTILVISSFRLRATVLSVVQVPLEQHRAIVVLVPETSYGTVGTILWLRSLIELLPRRIRPTEISLPNNDTITQLHFKSAKSTYTSYSLIGSDVSTQLTSQELLDIRASLASSNISGKSGFDQKKQGPGAMKAQFNFRAELPLSAITLAQLSEMGRDGSITLNVYDQRQPRVIIHGEFPDEVKTGVRPLGKPYTNETILIPAKTRGNDETMVKGRVTNIQHKEDIPTTEKMNMHEDEFLDFMMKDRYPVHDLADQETIEEHQTRPTQRTITAEGVEYDISGAEREIARQGIRSFMKSEITSGIPRNISTFPSAAKVMTALLYYVVVPLISAQHFYGFASPAVVEERVAGKTSRKARGYATDYSRWDGYVSAACRRFEAKFLARATAGTLHTLAMRVHAFLFNNKGTTSFGVKYEQLYSRASGSMFTSGFNTLTNAMIAYHGLRLSGLSPETAWNELGVFGGDDGWQPEPLDGSTDLKANLQRAAVDYGAVLVCDERVAGQTIPFLARHHGPGTWHGETNSCHHQGRMAKSFAVTTQPENVSDLHVLVTKCRSNDINDPNTPIPALINKTVLAIAAATGGFETKHDELSYSARQAIRGGRGYTNKHEPWMDEQMVEDLGGPVNMELLAGHCERARQANSLEMMLDLPIITSAVPAEPKVLGDVPVYIIDQDGDEVAVKQPAAPVAPAESDNIGSNKLTKRAKKRRRQKANAKARKEGQEEVVAPVKPPLPPKPVRKTTVSFKPDPALQEKFQHKGLLTARERWMKSGFTLKAWTPPVAAAAAAAATAPATKTKGRGRGRPAPRA